MRAPLSWLRDFAPIGGSPEELADVLSNLGLVVDGVERIGSSLDGIVVAKVLGLRPHPNADRIQLVEVDSGDGDGLQICCGAFNMAVGDLVPLAMLGTVMPSGLEIARRKLRGEWSNGMLCSADELGLPGAGPDGILVLPAGVAAPGTPLSEALGLEPDVVFELDVSPNRPDALSMMGVARDLAAALRLPFSLPACDAAVDAALPAAAVEVGAGDLAPRFTGTVVAGVSVGPSPAWLVRRLAVAGMRSINNVVDVSNYVMLDVGQPNHAYDLDRLGGGGLLVRRASDDETLVTLDGIERRLSSSDGLICDAGSVPVGIAGIMGGASSEISEATTTVLLEAAYFDPMSVARTAKRLGLYTEARLRFERGADPGIIDYAIDRFVSLLPGARRGPTTDRRAAGHLPAARPLSLRVGRVNALLGTELADVEIISLLESIGFSATAADAGTYEVTVPTWRPDTEREIDLIEEVARLYGYGRIQRTMPPGVRTGGGLSDYQRERRTVREVLVGAGLDEAWTTTFLAPGDLERAGLSPEAVEVENPLDRSESLLRRALLPGLLKASRFNLDRQASGVRLFEIGHVFAPPAAGQAVPLEWEELAVIVVGPAAGARDAAEIWTVLSEALRLDDVAVVAGQVPGLHPTRGARIVEAGTGTQLGALGEVDPEVSAEFGLPGRVGYLTVGLEPLLASRRRPAAFRPVSRFPASDVDLAFIVADDVPAADLSAALRAAGGDLLESVQLFDVYRGERLGGDHRSLAYRIRLRALDHTLTEPELTGARQALIAAAQALGGQLRA